MKNETEEYEVDDWGYRILAKQARSKKNANHNPTDDESVRLLRQIERNTSATHFWTRVTGIPVLIGMM